MTDGAHEAGQAPQGHSALARDVRTRRRVAVAALMAAHVTTREMAQQLNVGKGTIDRDVKVVRRWWQHRASLDYDRLVAEEIGTLDELMRAVMPQARGGDLFAVDRALRIAESRRRLQGTDAAQRTEAEITVHTVTTLDIEIEALMAAMRTDEPAG